MWTDEKIAQYLQNKPAQKEIYAYLLKQPSGELGAVRTNQIARGYSDETQCGSGACLRPLYELVGVGIVATTSDRNSRNQKVTRYFVDRCGWTADNQKK